MGALVAVFLLALLLRVPALDRGLGQDELFTAVHFVEAGSVRQTLFSNVAFNNHIFYSLMARGSERIFGRSEWALRLPALLLGVAAVPVLFLFARELCGTVPALLASSMLALSPRHVTWSMEARGYSALVFFALVSTGCYFALRRRARRRIALVFVCSSVLAAYSHLYGLFVPLVQGLLLTGEMGSGAALAGEARRSLRLRAVSLAATLALAGGLYLPVLLPIWRDLTGRGRIGFDPSFPWVVVTELSGTSSGIAAGLLSTLAIAGWFVLRRTDRWAARYFAVLLGAPLGIMWLARPFDLYGRFFAYWLPFFLLLASVGFVTGWRAASRLGAVRSMLALALAVLLFVRWVDSGRRWIASEGYREAAQAVWTSDPSVAFCAIGGARSVWRYYIERPLSLPRSVADLEQLLETHRELRIVYYEARWQEPAQTEIARFLASRAVSGRTSDSLRWFVYRAPSRPSTGTSR